MTELKKILFFSLIGFIGQQMAYADIPVGLQVTSVLSVDAEAPPALVNITDAQGRMTGADFSIGVNQYGQQGTAASASRDIPYSGAIQQNFASGGPDDAGQPQPNTDWEIIIYNGSAQTYNLSVKGLMDAVEPVYVTALFGKGQNKISDVVNALVAMGQVRTFAVNFDPSAQILDVAPRVGPGDLLTDIQIACRLKEIKSEFVCRKLSEKAEAIQKLIESGHRLGAEALLKSFLCNLGKTRGFKDGDEDEKQFISENVVEVLTADAESLLDGLGDKPGRR